MFFVGFFVGAWFGVSGLVLHDLCRGWSGSRRPYSKPTITRQPSHDDEIAYKLLAECDI